MTNFALRSVVWTLVFLLCGIIVYDSNVSMTRWLIYYTCCGFGLAAADDFVTWIIRSDENDRQSRTDK